MDLNFQNFESVNSTNEQNGPFGGNIGDRNNLVGGNRTAGGSNLFDDSQSTTSTRRSNFFSLEYYQQFFDVETDQVVKRLLNSVVPTHHNYIQDFLQPIPDLWGPFWVSITLIFSIAIFGNLAQFIENDGAKGSYGSDFRMVTSASTLVFLYVVLVPLIIYGLLWNRKSEMMHPYVDLVCLYGYSLTIFIPITFLWIIDIGWFRWALIFVSVALSGTVLARAIWPAIKNDSNKMVAFGTIASVVVLHFLLAFTFKEFYFDAMHPRGNINNKLEKVDIPITSTLPVIINSTKEGQKVPEAPAQISNPAESQIIRKEAIESAEKVTTKQSENNTKSTITTITPVDSKTTDKSMKISTKTEEASVISNNKTTPVVSENNTKLT